MLKTAGEQLIFFSLIGDNKLTNTARDNDRKTISF